MVETLLFVGIGTVLVIGTTTLYVAILTLRKASEYVELAEERLEHLREEQARLAVLLHETRERLQEAPAGQRAPAHQLARQGARTAPAGPAAPEAAPLSEAERKLEELKRELLDSRRRRHEPTQTRPQRGSTRGAFSPNEPGRDRPQDQEPEREPEQAPRRPRPAAFPETATGAGRGTKDTPRGEKPVGGPGRAVWHPHPDDAAGPKPRPAEPLRALNDASMGMFRRHYDRYLENYEGYVRLAERTCRMRETSGAEPGSPEDREWQEKMGRVEDSIKRTTARLDILEEYNPELATDDRISRRAAIARSHAKLRELRPRG